MDTFISAHHDFYSSCPPAPSRPPPMYFPLDMSSSEEICGDSQGRPSTDPPPPESVESATSGRHVPQPPCPDPGNKITL